MIPHEGYATTPAAEPKHPSDDEEQFDLYYG